MLLIIADKPLLLTVLSSLPFWMTNVSCWDSGDVLVTGSLVMISLTSSLVCIYGDQVSCAWWNSCLSILIREANTIHLVDNWRSLTAMPMTGYGKHSWLWIGSGIHIFHFADKRATHPPQTCITSCTRVQFKNYRCARLHLFVCLLGNLCSISEKSNWLQSLAAYLRNTRKRDSYHPWPINSKAAPIITREDGWFSRNNPLRYARPSSVAVIDESDKRPETWCILKPPIHVTFSPGVYTNNKPAIQYYIHIVQYVSEIASY